MRTKCACRGIPNGTRQMFRTDWQTEQKHRDAGKTESQLNESLKCEFALRQTGLLIYQNLRASFAKSHFSATGRLPRALLFNSRLYAASIYTALTCAKKKIHFFLLTQGSKMIENLRRQLAYKAYLDQSERTKPFVNVPVIISLYL